MITAEFGGAENLSIPLRMKPVTPSKKPQEITNNPSPARTAILRQFFMIHLPYMPG